MSKFKFNIGKISLAPGFSEPEFYGDLGYKLKINDACNNFQCSLLK